jgi:hypothetical protein
MPLAPGTRLGPYEIVAPLGDHICTLYDIGRQDSSSGRLPSPLAFRQLNFRREAVFNAAFRERLPGFEPVRFRG